MIEGLPWPVQLGVGGAGWALAFGFMWLQFTGRAATGRELREKNGRIEFLQDALAERDKQLSLVLGETVPVTSTVLAALHRALEEGDSKT